MDPNPQIGDGATLVFYSDRKAATVVEVTDFYITVQYDKAIRTDSNGVSDSQSYRYERDTNGPTRRFHKATMASGGVRLSLAGRDHYHDYSF